MDSAVREWTVDTVAPNTSIDSGPNGTVNTASATFTFSGSGGHNGFECKLDDDAFSDCTSSKTYNNLPDGSHAFQVRATDAAGNKDPSPAERKWTIDASPPTANIGQKPSNPSTDASPTFEFGPNENGVTFHCTLDGAPVPTPPCTSPKGYTNVGEGQHTFKVYAVDQAGNGGPNNPTSSDSYTWTIGFPPKNQNAPTISGTAQGGQTLTASPGTWSGTGNESFEYDWERCQGGGGCDPAGSGPTHLLTGEDVDHKMKVTVTATNAFGTDEAESALYPGEGLVSDVTAPGIDLFRSPRNVTRSRTAVFRFTSDDKHAQFACKRDGQAVFRPCQSPKIYRNLRPGDHEFHLQATDRSNKTTTVSDFWTIDRTRPPKPAGFDLRGGDRRVVATWANPRVGDFAFVRIVRSASPGKVVYQGRKTHFRDRKVRNGKRYKYTIQAFDKAGNRSGKAKRVVRPRDPLFRPREGARIKVKNPPLFVWQRDRSARSYNLQLFRWQARAKRWVKIQSVFPTRNRYQLPRRWRCAGECDLKRAKFTQGLYSVHVWPWYGTRFGPKIGSNTFRGV